MHAGSLSVSPYLLWANRYRGRQEPPRADGHPRPVLRLVPAYDPVRPPAGFRLAGNRRRGCDGLIWRRLLQTLHVRLHVEDLHGLVQQSLQGHEDTCSDCPAA